MCSRSASPRSKSLRNLNEIEQSRLSCSQFGKFLLALRLAVTLTFDLLTLNCCGRSDVMCSICVKFQQNRKIRCRVIDDLAHYRREIFEGVAFTRKDLRHAWTEPHQTYRRHTAITCGHEICFSVEISCSAFKCRVLKVERR